MVATLAAFPDGASGYSRRFRSPFHQRRLLVQSVDAVDRVNFSNISCAPGKYDRAAFSALDAVCDDCYDLFREPEIHSLCRSDCFTSGYFKRCVEALLVNEEKEKLYREMASALAGGGNKKRREE